VHVVHKKLKEETDMPKSVDEVLDELKQLRKKVQIGASEYYVVEGDLLLDEDELFAYAFQRAAPSEAPAAGLTIERSSLVGMTDDQKHLVRWAKGLVLTYAVLKGTFTTDNRYQTVVNAMRRATADWEATCGVAFQHLDALDDGSVPFGGNPPLFVVRGVDSGGLFIAAAFFPTDPPEERQLVIDPLFFGPKLGYNQIGVLRHELGHTLGFRHEHIRSGAPADCPHESLSQTFDFTPYDPQSVMHYFCGGVGTTEMEITDSDREGARMLYGPPDSEVIYCR
jgi:hypothetical protein